MTKKKTEKVEVAPVITAYKGFAADFTCNGAGNADPFQFAVGQTYEHKGPVKACQSGFHACEDPGHVLRYYRANASRFAVVEQSGDIDRHDEDSKLASRSIFIKAEITLTDLIKAAVTFRTSRCTPADGAISDKPNTAVKAEGRNQAATASGNYGAATASGYSGAATASGNSGRVRGKDGCALFLVERNSRREILNVWAGIAGRDGIKADTFYRLTDGVPVEAA